MEKNDTILNLDEYLKDKYQISKDGKKYLNNFSMLTIGYVLSVIKFNSFAISKEKINEILDTIRLKEKK